MFEPISVVGIVGTAMGLIGFLASTVENINTRKHLYQECGKRLIDYKHRLETIELELMHWSRTWSKEMEGQTQPYLEHTYEYFWGPEGFNEVRNRVKRVIEESKSLSELLECRDIVAGANQLKALNPDWSHPSEHELSNWKQLIRTYSQNPRTKFSAEKWHYKFAFALYKNSNIKSQIDNLQQIVGDLEKHCRLRFQEIHTMQEQVTKQKDLQEMAALHSEQLRLVDFFNQIYTTHYHANMRWDIVLGTPNLDMAIENLKTSSKSQLRFEFLASTEYGSKQSRPIINIAYPRDNHEGGNLQDRVNQWDRILQPLAPCDRHLLQHNQIDILDLTELSLYIFAALSAVRSSVLLYKSHWVQGLCVCGMRVYETRELRIAAECYDPKYCEHVPIESHQDVFLLLGLLLAELALGAPIKLVSQAQEDGASSVPLFELPDCLLGTGQQNDLLTWRKLIDHLDDAIYDSVDSYISVTYLKVVEFCFQKSSQPVHRGSFHDNLLTCLEKIVKPLEEEYERILQRLSELKQRAWYQNVLAKEKGKGKESQTSCKNNFGLSLRDVYLMEESPTD